MTTRPFSEERNALVLVLGLSPVNEVEPFAPLDPRFRIRQQVLVPADPRTDSRSERCDRPQPEETLLENGTVAASRVLIAKEAPMR